MTMHQHDDQGAPESAAHDLIQTQEGRLKAATDAPEHISAARLAAASRALAGMVRLGGAFAGSLADIGLKAAWAREGGEGWLEGWHEELAATSERLQGEEKKELGRQLGVYARALLGGLYSKFDVNDALSGEASRRLNAAVKVSDPEDWLDIHRAARVCAASNRLARLAERGEPDRELAARLRRHGLLDRLDLLGRMTDECDGEGYVLPEHARRLTDAELEAHLPEALRDLAPESPEAAGHQARQAARAAACARLRDDLARGLAAYFAEEARGAEPGPAGENGMDGGMESPSGNESAPGSVSGEMQRLTRQLGVFPVRPMPRGAARTRGMNMDMPGFIHFFASATVLGLVIMVSGDIRAGREPRSPRKYPLETALSAMLKGGGLGLLGDFCLGTARDMADGDGIGTLTARLARGPAEGAEGADNDAESALRRLMDTPPANLWYTRLALDYLVNYHVREELNRGMPQGTLQRGEQALRRAFRRKYLDIGAA